MHNKKVFTGHSEGFGYREGEVHFLIEELNRGHSGACFRMSVGQIDALLQMLCLS